MRQNTHMGMSAQNLCKFLIFFQNYFCNNSIYIGRICKCVVDVRSASRGAWQDHAHFKMP